MDIGKKASYYRIPCGFDIETSSFYEDGEKRGMMYEWTFGIDGYIIIGRTWNEFIECMNDLIEFFHLNGKTRIMIGVHNLAFEFQFMRKWFKWDKVFSVDLRKPAYAITNGLEWNVKITSGTKDLTSKSTEEIYFEISGPPCPSKIPKISIFLFVFGIRFME